MTTLLRILCALALLALVSACDNAEKEPTSGGDTEAHPPAVAEDTVSEAPEPPTPPIRETFEKSPQLSLFPRVAAFRPAEGSEGLSYWRTYIEHLHKTSGLAPDGTGEGKAWAIKGLKGLDSVGFFSPLSVEPETSYRVEFSFRGPLPEGGEAGLGVLEFDRFLWIGDQFTEEQLSKYLTGSVEGVRLEEGSEEWQRHRFDFTTGERTRMIHLILFRDGTQQREPVLFDEISIATADSGKSRSGSPPPERERTP